MSSPSQSGEDFFLGVLVLKDGKWTPHSKFPADAFGTALMRAEDADKDPGFDGVKIMRVPKKGAGQQKEMWISPRAKARVEAQRVKQLQKGVTETQAKLAAARKASVKKN